MQPPQVLPVESLDDLISLLRDVFSKDQVDIEHVRSILEGYHSKPVEWRKYAVFDAHKYTRNLVDTGNGKYNLMLLCWSPGQGSAIHDHANSHCFMKVLAGTLTEVRFDWPASSKHSPPSSDQPLTDQDRMKVIGQATLATNQCAYINDSLGLHRMENRDHSTPCVTLHLYSPPYSSCKTFDERTGHTNEVKVTFTTKFGKRTPFKVKSGESKGKKTLNYEKIDS